MAPIVLSALVDADLRLRPPIEADVATITAICQDPDIARFTRIPHPYTEADAHTFVELARDGLATGGGVPLVAVDDDDRVLGAVGLDIDGRDLTADLGYWVGPDARRRGVATRGGRLLSRFAFEGLGLAYLSLQAAAHNGPSNAVARALGFTFEGTARGAMLDGLTGDADAPRADANRYGLRPDELI